MLLGVIGDVTYTPGAYNAGQRYTISRGNHSMARFTLNKGRYLLISSFRSDLSTGNIYANTGNMTVISGQISATYLNAGCIYGTPDDWNKIQHMTALKIVDVKSDSATFDDTSFLFNGVDLLIGAQAFVSVELKHVNN
jgi:hypothetical protein